MPLIKGKDGRVYKGNFSKGYKTKLDKSVGDVDILENKFFSTRREISPPKINQSLAQSRKKFIKPTNALPRRRCTTALSRQTKSASGFKKNHVHHSDPQNIDDSGVYQAVNVYEQAI